ncbi:MAG: hypothetical protein DRQ54_01630 [Gammaproteobacteria bacterium]|nr:MAG: hypothetical protein DRQ54_01630 [Gammaproteobacteria bacterium]RLA15084.1 MAG: hypothetical protein DRQ52_02715 [Gammaproteobacteria bacterium]
MRLLGATLIALLLFFTAIALVMISAFRHSGEQALNERLLSEIYGLLAAAEVSLQGEILFPEQFPQFRFLQPDSGLVGEVFAEGGRSLWRSASMGSRELTAPAWLAPGESGFDSPVIDSETWYRATLTVDWEYAGERSFLLQFAVAEEAAVLEAEVHNFRNQVIAWLGVAGVALLLIQGLLMRWGLAPLGRAAREIDQVKAGRRQVLGEDYPVELMSLTQNLNSLLEQQSSHLQRYRNALADAAHSIKTPLTALKNSLAGDSESLRQLDAVDRTVEYHLKKAATGGPIVMRAPVAVEPLVNQLVASLKKVYADKNPHFKVDVESGSQFAGDAGDFLELLGNLLDNACKWAATEVGCSIRTVASSGNDLLQMEIVDDGPGVDPAIIKLIVQRGVQVDSQHGGQGIGLAVVRGILDFYRGTLEVSQTPGGGALFVIQIPLN